MAVALPVAALASACCAFGQATARAGVTAATGGCRPTAEGFGPLKDAVAFVQVTHQMLTEREASTQLPALGAAGGSPVHRTPSASGWYAAGDEQSCADECSNEGLVCDQDDFFDHLGDVDSADEVRSVSNATGGPAFEAWQYHESAGFNDGLAPYWVLDESAAASSGESVTMLVYPKVGFSKSSVDCGRGFPAGGEEHLLQQRLCYCTVPPGQPVPPGTGAPTAAPTAAPTGHFPAPGVPAPTGAPTGAPAPTRAPTGAPAGVTGDPHVTNVEGDRFNLARAGVHELLRLPRRSTSRSGPGADGRALLEVLCTVESEQSCAEPFIRRLDLGGLWLARSGPLAFRAGGQRKDGPDAVVLEVNRSRVHKDDLAREPELQRLVQVSEPGANRSRRRGAKIHRDKFLKVTLRFPGATLTVDWVHREVPGSVVNHLDLHVVGLPKLEDGMDIGGILGRDDHSMAATPSPGCALTRSLISFNTTSDMSASLLRASYHN